MPHKCRRNAQGAKFLCRFYEIDAYSVWNSYVQLCTFRGTDCSPDASYISEGVAMKTHVKTKGKVPLPSASPYSAPLCVLMLLLAGMLVKFGPALHLFHAQN
jgi:hypothetical protein